MCKLLVKIGFCFWFPSLDASRQCACISDAMSRCHGAASHWDQLPTSDMPVTGPCLLLALLTIIELILNTSTPPLTQHHARFWIRLSLQTPSHWGLRCRKGVSSAFVIFRLQPNPNGSRPTVLSFVTFRRRYIHRKLHQHHWCRLQDSYHRTWWKDRKAPDC